MTYTRVCVYIYIYIYAHHIAYSIRFDSIRFDSILFYSILFYSIILIYAAEEYFEAAKRQKTTA